MRIAVFPGSFDPFTLAHQDIIERALPLFDEIYIAIGENSSKTGLMEVALKMASISDLFKENTKIKVDKYKGLTIDFCKKVEAKFILRGLRNTTDLDYESIIAQNNLILAPEIETYFLISRTGKSHISSTIVRDIWRNKGDLSALVPRTILTYIENIKLS
ncbi:MAG: pantetheine-phosphate adenylyltransferase [Sphingobacterium sp.]